MARKKGKGEETLKKEGAKVKGFFADFKNFITKGNIIDLAVGVVIGTAFTAIVSSLVADIIMPFIGLIIGKSNIAEMKWQITDELAVSWGAFVMAIINFLLIAFTIFVVLRIMVKAKNDMGKIKTKVEAEVKGNEGVTQDETAEGAEEVVAADAAETVSADTAPESASTDATPAKIETNEDIMRDIRDLLKKLNMKIDGTTDETPQAEN